MTKKVQISTSVPKRTRSQADGLIEHGGYGTMSHLLAVLIDRAWLAEMPSDKARADRGESVICADCGGTILAGEEYRETSHGAVLCWACFTPDEEKRAEGIFP